MVDTESSEHLRAEIKAQADGQELGRLTILGIFGERVGTVGI